MPTIDNWRSTLMRAAINCPHDIEEESVLLEQSSRQSRDNALAQLADRLAEAVKPLLDERDRLAAEVEALRADAERYRWLRDKSVPPHQFYVSVPDEFAGVKFTPGEVDAAIDAARGIKEGGAS